MLHIACIRKNRKSTFFLKKSIFSKKTVQTKCLICFPIVRMWIGTLASPLKHISIVLQMHFPSFKFSLPTKVDSTVGVDKIYQPYNKTSKLWSSWNTYDMMMYFPLFDMSVKIAIYFFQAWSRRSWKFFQVGYFKIFEKKQRAIKIYDRLSLRSRVVDHLHHMESVHILLLEEFVYKFDSRQPKKYLRGLIGTKAEVIFLCTSFLVCKTVVKCYYIFVKILQYGEKNDYLPFVLSLIHIWRCRR